MEPCPTGIPHWTAECTALPRGVRAGSSVQVRSFSSAWSGYGGEARFILGYCGAKRLSGHGVCRTNLQKHIPWLVTLLQARLWCLTERIVGSSGPWSRGSKRAGKSSARASRITASRSALPPSLTGRAGPHPQEDHPDRARNGYRALGSLFLAPLPGPGFATVFLGLAILAGELLTLARLIDRVEVGLRRVGGG